MYHLAQLRHMPMNFSVYVLATARSIHSKWPLIQQIEDALKFAIQISMLIYRECVWMRVAAQAHLFPITETIVQVFA